VLTVVPGAADADDRRDGGSSLIDELVREGARRMLAEALQAEVDDYIARFAAERDENGHRLVVRNGSHADLRLQRRSCTRSHISCGTPAAWTDRIWPSRYWTVKSDYAEAAGPERRQLAASDARSLRARRASMLSSARSSATAISRELRAAWESR
jgi:hypothetical protein